MYLEQIGDNEILSRIFALYIPLLEDIKNSKKSLRESFWIFFQIEFIVKTRYHHLYEASSDG
jgi:hypothetical protein